MKLPPFAALSPLGRVVCGVALLAAVAVGWFLITAPARNAAAAKAARAEAALADSRTRSAADAVEITARSGARDAAADRLTQETRDAIRNAPGADQRLDPALNAAGLRGLCRRAAYRGRPECVQHARSIQPQDARPRG